MRRCTKSRSLSLFLVPSLLALPLSFLKNRDAVFLSGLDLYFFSHVMSLHYAAGSGEETVCSCWLFPFRSHPCRQEPRKQTCEFWRRLSLPARSSDPKVVVILAIGQVFLCSLFRALAPPEGGREGGCGGGRRNCIIPLWATLGRWRRRWCCESPSLHHTLFLHSLGRHSAPPPFPLAALKGLPFSQQNSFTVVGQLSTPTVFPLLVLVLLVWYPVAPTVRNCSCIHEREVGSCRFPHSA